MNLGDAGFLVLVDPDFEVGEAVHQSGESQTYSQHDTGQQVQSDDAGERYDVNGGFPPVLVPKNFGELQLGQLDAGINQHRCQTGDRDRAQDARKQRHEQQQPNSVQEGGHSGAAARHDIGRRADNDARDRDHAHEAAEHIAGSLRHQLAVVVCALGMALHRIRRRGGEQRLRAGDEGQGQSRQPDRALAQPAEPGHRRPTDRVQQLLGDRNVFHVQFLMPCGGGGDGDADERSRQQLELLGREQGPQRHRGDGQQADQRRGDDGPVP